MGYPSGIQTFTSKSNGQSIDASHVNGLQTEVTAVETGLLNGFQHAITVAVAGITQSASTGSNNFAGPSSFAGTLSVTGESTFTGGATFSSNVTVNGTLTAPGVLVPKYARLAREATLQCAAGAWVGLDWDTEIEDASGMHSTASNSSRLTFAGSTGLYRVDAMVSFSTLANGPWLMRIRQNDSSVVAYTAASSPANDESGLVLTALVRASDLTDYVTVQVQPATSTGSVMAESTAFVNRFSAMLVSS